MKDKRVVDLFDAVVDAANEGLRHWEQIKRIALLPKEFTIEAGELTPKLSLRRKTILANNTAIAEELYGAS